MNLRILLFLSIIVFCAGSINCFKLTDLLIGFEEIELNERPRRHVGDGLDNAANDDEDLDIDDDDDEVIEDHEDDEVNPEDIDLTISEDDPLFSPEQFPDGEIVGELEDFEIDEGGEKEVAKALESLLRRRQLLSPTGFRLMVTENGTVKGTRTDYDINGILEVATEESLDDKVEDEEVKKAFAHARENDLRRSDILPAHDAVPPTRAFIKGVKSHLYICMTDDGAVEGKENIDASCIFDVDTQPDKTITLSRRMPNKDSRLRREAGISDLRDIQTFYLAVFTHHPYKGFVKGLDAVTLLQTDPHSLSRIAKQVSFLERPVDPEKVPKLYSYEEAGVLVLDTVD